MSETVFRVKIMRKYWIHVMNWLAYKKNWKQAITGVKGKGEQKIAEVGQRNNDWVVQYYSEWVKKKNPHLKW